MIPIPDPLLRNLRDSRIVLLLRARDHNLGSTATLAGLTERRHNRQPIRTERRAVGKVGRVAVGEGGDGEGWGAEVSVRVDFGGEGDVGDGKPGVIDYGFHGKLGARLGVRLGLGLGQG